MKKPRRIAFVVAIAVIALAALSFLVPVMVRLISPPPAPDTPGMYRPSSVPGLPHEHTPGAEGLIAGVRVRINAQGFRGGELQLEKPAGTVRVAVLGDSVVFGQGVEEAETLPAQLENLLIERAPETGWETVNAGVRGYNSPHYVVLFEERVLPLDPDFLVLVITEINDPEREPFIPRSEKIEKWRQSFWDKVPLVRSLRAGAYADEVNRLFSEHVRGLYDPEGREWPLFVSDLAAIRDLCRERGIALVAVTFPLLEEGDLFRDERARLQGALAELGLDWVDPLPEFERHSFRDLVVSKRDFHPNRRALSITARLIADKMLEAE